MRHRDAEIRVGECAAKTIKRRTVFLLCKGRQDCLKKHALEVEITSVLLWGGSIADASLGYRIYSTAYAQGVLRVKSA